MKRIEDFYPVLTRWERMRLLLADYILPQSIRRMLIGLTLDAQQRGVRFGE